jgi:cob(I)alamin adenosyltransferase
LDYSRSRNKCVVYKKLLVEIQDRLFTVGAILATPPEKEVLKNGEKRFKTSE